MAIQIKRMNWFRAPTAREQAEAWQQKRRANREQYEKTRAAAAAAFGAAWSKQIAGLGDLAMQQAAKRIRAAAELRLSAAQSEIDKLA